MKKILHIGFGYEPFWEGGMVLYQLDMMRGLKRRGYEIIFFAAGRYDLRRSPYLKERIVEDIKMIEFVNSPNPYNPYCRYVEPQKHCQNRVVEDLTRTVIKEEHPVLVHLHDLRMHSASVIDVVKEFDLPIIKTVHNFWDLCPRDSLLYQDKESCIDFQKGEKCIVCLNENSNGQIPIITRIMGSLRLGVIVSGLKRLQKGEKVARKLWESGFRKRPVYASQAYEKRRQCFVDKLRRCDIIHTTSDYCADKYAEHGIARNRMRTAALSVSLLAQINAKVDSPVEYPITFGYRGGLHYAKGIHILLAAFARMDPNKCRLVIYGPGDKHILKGFSSQPNIEYRGKYSPKHMPDSLTDIDVGVVPSICEEAFGIVGPEYLNARIPVIGSKIGGIPEWLKHGQNGFLFQPGNIDDLAGSMERFLNEPQLLQQIRSNIKPWKTVEDHVSEISGFYEELIYH